MDVSISNTQRALIEGALKMARAQASSLNARSTERAQYIAHFDEALLALSDAETDSQPAAALVNIPPHLRELARKQAA